MWTKVDMGGGGQKLQENCGRLLWMALCQTREPIEFICGRYLPWTTATPPSPPPTGGVMGPKILRSVTTFPPEKGVVRVTQLWQFSTHPVSQAS